MATIKILGGNIPKQTASYLFGVLTIKDCDRKSQTYISKEAIKFIEKISEHKKSITFKLTLKDKVSFLGTSNRKTYDSLVADQMTSEQSKENCKVTENINLKSSPLPFEKQKEFSINSKKEKKWIAISLGITILLSYSYVYWKDEHFITAISFLAASLLLLPMTKHWMIPSIEKKKGWIVFGLIILGCFSIPSDERNNFIQTNNINSPIEQLRISETNTREPAEVAEVSKRNTKNENYIIQINREIELLSKPIGERDRDTFKSIKNMQAKILSFAIMPGMIREAESLDLTDDQKATVENLRTKVLTEQKRVFPKIRDKYGPLARQALWQDDIHVKTTGNKYNTITYSWHMLAANNNKQQLYNTVFEDLMLFRFKEVRMSWYKGQDEFTYWDIPSKDDGVF